MQGSGNHIDFHKPIVCPQCGTKQAVLGAHYILPLYGTVMYDPSKQRYILRPDPDIVDGDITAAELHDGVDVNAVVKIECLSCGTVIWEAKEV